MSSWFTHVTRVPTATVTSCSKLKLSIEICFAGPFSAAEAPPLSARIITSAASPIPKILPTTFIKQFPPVFPLCPLWLKLFCRPCGTPCSSSSSAAPSALQTGICNRQGVLAFFEIHIRHPEQPAQLLRRHLHRPGRS